MKFLENQKYQKYSNADVFIYASLLGVTSQRKALSQVTEIQINDQLKKDGYFHIEQKIADEIMATIISLQLPFKLDQLTEGLGNCFPMAIIQQLRKPEIRSQLRPTEY